MRGSMDGLPSPPRFLLLLAENVGDPRGGWYTKLDASTTAAPEDLCDPTRRFRRELAKRFLQVTPLCSLALCREGGEALGAGGFLTKSSAAESGSGFAARSSFIISRGCGLLSSAAWPFVVALLTPSCCC